MKIINYNQYDNIFKRKEQSNLNKYNISLSWITMSNQCKIIEEIRTDKKEIILKDDYKQILKNYRGMPTI